MTAPRPTCVHCGKVYGQRRTTTAVVVWHKDDERPRYRGNGIVLKDRGPHGEVSILQNALGRAKNSFDRYAFLDVWDGQSWWGGYEPFCTLRCALDYARRAYRRDRRK